MLAQDVLAPPAKAAIFLTLTVRSGQEAAVREALADVPGLKRAVAFRIPELRLSCVVGIGSDLWDRTYRGRRPAGLHPFVPLDGGKHQAPSTAGDLLFHIRADRADACFELSHQLLRRLDGLVDCVEEVHGFRYWDERDLLGFVDGTESPSIFDDASVAALVDDQDPPFVGGSYVIVQKYLHELQAWDALPVEQQELVIGRRMLSDIEIPDDAKPTNSHVALNSISDADGNDLAIVRDNLPFGNAGAGEFGTYFIGYAADPAITERMLRNMFLGNPAGNHDRILDFSRAVTGCLFFVPPAAFLEDPEPYLAEKAGAEQPGADTPA
jgi:putative iron-dependent peroxidase